MGTCSHDVCVGLPGLQAACSRGPASPCLLASGSLSPQGPLDLPAYQDHVHHDCVPRPPPPLKFCVFFLSDTLKTLK